MKIEEVRGPRGPSEPIRLGGYQCMMHGSTFKQGLFLDWDVIDSLVILNTEDGV